MKAYITNNNPGSLEIQKNVVECEVTPFDTAVSIAALLTTKGDTFVRSATGIIRNPVGTDGQVEIADSTSPTGKKWVSSAYQVGATLTNRSGALAETGSVVKLDTTNPSSFTTTTTEGDVAVFGVTGADIEDTASGSVLVSGDVGTVLVTGTVAVGDRLSSSTTAKRAVASRTNPFAVALTANASGDGTVTAVILDKAAPTMCSWLGLDIVTSKTMAPSYSSSQLWIPCVTGPVSPLDGDEYYFYGAFGAGTYKILTYGSTSSGLGKIDYYIDGVLVSSGQDWYSASPVMSVNKTISSVVVPVSGHHTIKLKVNGKNASSSGYSISFTRMVICQIP